jgi:hypothetical protein
MLPYILTVVLSVLGAWLTARVMLNRYYLDNVELHQDLVQLRKEHEAFVNEARRRWDGGK